MVKMDPSIRDRVRVEQMRMLFESPFPGMLLANAFACAFAWEMRDSVAGMTIAIWLALKLLAVLPRAFHAFAFSHRASDSLGWLTAGIALLLVDGLAWGSAGVFLMVPQDRAVMTVVATSLAGVAAIAAFALHADSRASAAFTVPMLLPTVGYFLWRGDSFGAYGAAAIAIFLVLLLAAARRSEHHVVELLALRFRNASLTAQLQAALERTERESHAKDVFVANMSHELRTPLHGILGLSKTLSRRVPAAERASVDLIRKSGEHLLGLINNILEFSRFKARGIDLHPTEIDVVRLVEDATALFVPGAQERRIALRLQNTIGGPYYAVADPYRLRQILMNLIGNAVKFTDPGGSVTVELARRVDASGLRVSIADTGVGIGADVMEQLFEPFRQGDNSASRRHGGTGLGLHITREICRAIGGDVTCTSQPGKGSVFVVELPLQAITPGEGRTGASGADSGFMFGRTAAGATVLLAEDNEVNALVAEAALHRFGLEVEHVQTGLQVVNRLCTRAERPDLVLLDCQMPELDGYEACRRVRAYEHREGLPNVPIVALTANVFPQDRELCRKAGMDGFLGKPFTEQELHQVLAAFAIVGPIDDAATGPNSTTDYAARL